MTSVTRSSVIALLCWVVVTQAGATGSDDFDQILDFIFVWNGVYDDMDQVKNNNKNRDILRVRHIPVKLTGLGGPAFYFEESMNGVVYRQQLEVVTEVINKVIYISSFNFTDSSRPDPENMKPDDLANLKAEDFQPADPSCKSPFERIGPGVYSGNYVDCRVTNNGQHPADALTITCDRLSVTFPWAAKEVTTLPPYIQIRRGDRFPAKNLPANYVGPCDKKQ